MSEQEQENLSEQETLGEVVDKLGCTAPHLDAGDLVTDVIVLYKYQGLEDGQGGIGLANGEGTDNVLKIGILKACLVKELDDFMEGWLED